MKFSINPQIFEKWPNAKLGVVLVFSMNNNKQNDEILKLMQNQTEKSKEFSGQDLKSLLFISCWREAYRVFGASPKKYPSSIEALLERTSKGGKLPNINPLVNLYNYLSLKYLLPFGGEDLDEIKGNVELTFAKGDEKGKYIGSDKEDAAISGEVIYKDDAGFICRRWNWREADRTKFTESTKNAVLVAEIISPEFEKQLKESIDEISSLIGKYLGGKVKVLFLDKNNSSIEFDFVGRSKAEKVEKSVEVVEKHIGQKEPEKKIFVPLKNSFAEKLQNVVWDAMQNFVKGNADKLGSLSLQKEDIFLEHPEVENFGDYSCNVAMRLAKNLHKSPMEIAQTIVDFLQQLTINNQQTTIIEKIEVKAPGFINFWIKKEALFEILQKPYEFPKTGKKIMVEYSAPNPNKPLHLGHARNNALGMAMGGILKYLGSDVIYANWINNRGVAICKVMWGYLQTQSSKRPAKSGAGATQNWKELLNQWAENPSDWPLPNKKSDHFVMDFYVEAEKAEKENENVQQEFLEMLNDWEAGEDKVRKLWETIVGWAYQGWKETYQKQNCVFDKWYFESDFYQEGKDIIYKKLDEGLFYKDENKTIKARLEKYHLPDKVLIRSDGTSIYITPDLALARHKFADFNLDKSIYVVGADQELYFKQLFSVLDLLGFASVSQCHHLAYGMVNLTTGKMSTREGTVVLLDDVIADLTKKLQEKNEDETISEKVAIAAINYMMLKSGTRQEISFDPVKSIETEGNTGVYIQYCYVRTQSVIQKIPNSKTKPTVPRNDVSSYNTEEIGLLRTLYRFPEVVQCAADNYAPNLICNFLFDLAQKFNNFYAKHRIIEGERINEFRLFLTQKTGAVLKRGMEILNLPVVEKM